MTIVNFESLNVRWVVLTPFSTIPIKTEKIKTNKINPSLLLLPHMVYAIVIICKPSGTVLASKWLFFIGNMNFHMKRQVSFGGETFLANFTLMFFLN